MLESSTLPDLIRYCNLEELNLSRHALDRLIDTEAYERIAPGLFLRVGLTDDTTAGWMAISVKRPEATICLLSALALSGLTDEIPSRSDIAVPRGFQPVRIDHAPVAWHRFDVDTFHVGRIEHRLPGNLTIGRYSPERTIVDLFRLRHVWGADLAHAALKRWLGEHRSSPSLLLDTARPFPQAEPTLRAALEILL